MAAPRDDFSFHSHSSLTFMIVDELRLWWQGRELHALLVGYEATEPLLLHPCTFNKLAIGIEPITRRLQGDRSA